MRDPQRSPWYASRGHTELQVPPMPPAVANLADLYVHVVEGRTPPQVWLRIEPSAWVEAREGHAHPTLDGNFLRPHSTANPGG